MNLSKFLGFAWLVMLGSLRYGAKNLSSYLNDFINKYEQEN